MSEYSFYEPASARRRFVAFCLNLFFAILPAAMFKMIFHIEEGRLSTALLIVLILFFCVYPESPGKRMLSLDILDEKQRPISTRIRFFRAIPFVLICGTTLLPSKANDPVGIATALLFMTILIFIVANGMAVVFSPESHSLLDMKWGTRVFTPKKLPGKESPRIYGMKVW